MCFVIPIGLEEDTHLKNDTVLKHIELCICRTFTDLLNIITNVTCFS